MMKKNLLILFMLMLAMFLVACGSNEDDVTQDDNGGDTDTETDEEVELPEELLIWATTDEADVIESIVSGYTDETGIPVRVVPFAMDEQEEGISLDGPSGNGPDLFFQPGIGSLSLRGLVQPMTPGDDVLSIYSEGSVEALSYNGEVYGLPAVVESLALYYNTDLFPDVPETWADVEAFADEFTDASNDKFGFLYPAADFYFSFPMMAGYGAEIFSEENGVFDINDVGLASASAVEGGELIKSWFEKGYIPNGVNMDITGGLFEDGNVGAVINGPWALNAHLEALGDSLATAPLPQLDNGEYPETFLGTKGWMLSAYSEYPEAATDLAIFLTSEASLQAYFDETGEMPANSNILASDEFQNDPLLAGFATQLERAKPFPPVPALSTVWDPMADALSFITQGGDVEAMLQEAVDSVEQDIQMNYQ